GRFDERLVPTGCRFLFELSLVGEDESHEAEFQTLLEIVAGDLRLGGHTRRGLGRLRSVELAARTFDLTRPGDRDAFLDFPVSLAAPTQALEPVTPRPRVAVRPRATLRLRPRTPW